MLDDSVTLKERLAHFQHLQWSGWMEYLFEKSTHNNDGTVTIPAWAVERWERQLSTPYRLLPEDEKESDRMEADKYLPLFAEYGVQQVNDDSNLLNRLLRLEQTLLKMAETIRSFEGKTASGEEVKATRDFIDWLDNDTHKLRHNEF